MRKDFSFLQSSESEKLNLRMLEGAGNCLYLTRELSGT